MRLEGGLFAAKRIQYIRSCFINRSINLHTDVGGCEGAWDGLADGLADGEALGLELGEALGLVVGG